jgi:hypothetical protein
MKTNELLTLQALKFKQQLLAGASDLADTDPLWMSDSIEKPRNICAFISLPLSEEIERLCSVLSISKRRFVELALRDMAQKANEAIEAVGLTNVSVSTIGEFPVDEA